MDTQDKVKPNAWPIVRFGDVVRNARDTERDPLIAGIERYVGVADLQPEDLHIRSWGLVAEGTSFTRRFKEGQVLFAKRRAYQRKVAVAEFGGVCSGDLLIFEPKDDRLLPDLLPFIIQSDGLFECALRTSSGSLSPRTRWRDLAAYEFPLPPLDEQRRIAEILWAADNVVERWRRTQLATQDARDSVSHHLLDGNGTTPTATLGQICEYITVGIVIKPAELYVETGVPALRSLNVLPGRFSLNDVVYISSTAHREHTKSRLREGDVVIVRSGRPGDAAVIPAALDDINCIDLVIARPGGQVSPQYVSRYINSLEGRRQLDAWIVGTAQKHLNVSAVKKLKVPLLPLSQQEQIVETLSFIDDQYDALTAQLEQSAQLRAALLRKLLERDVAS